MYFFQLEILASLAVGSAKQCRWSQGAGKPPPLLLPHSVLLASGAGGLALSSSPSSVSISLPSFYLFLGCEPSSLFYLSIFSASLSLSLSLIYQKIGGACMCASAPWLPPSVCDFMISQAEHNTRCLEGNRRGESIFLYVRVQAA